MDLYSFERETLRDYNSLIRVILNSVDNIYNQHYEIIRLSMVNENNSTNHTNTRNRTTNNSYRDLRPNRNFLPDLRPNRNFFPDFGPNRNFSPDLRPNRNFFPRRNNIINNDLFSNSIFQRNRPNTNLYRRNRNTSFNNTSPTTNRFTTNRSTTNRSTSRPPSRPTTTRHTITGPIWSPFTTDLPSNIRSFINNTLDTPPQLDFPSYQQIENATISIKFKDVSNNTNDFCPITQESFLPDDNIIKILKCNHIFKRDALLNWFNTNSNCPICRFDIRNHISDSSNIESKTNENVIESKTNENVIESKTNENVRETNTYETSPFNFTCPNSTNFNQNLTNPFLNDLSFNPFFMNNTTNTDWPTSYYSNNTDLSNNYSTLSNIVSNNFESVISNFENVFSGAIENTIQDLSNNNINAELCYELIFPTSNSQ